MRLLTEPLGRPRPCSPDGRGYEALLAASQARLRRRAREELHAALGGPAPDEPPPRGPSVAPGHCAALSSPEALVEVDALLSNSPLDDCVDVFAAGELLDPAEVLEAAHHDLSGRFVEPGRLFRALTAGRTVRVNAVDRRLALVGEWARWAELASATTCNANLYLTGASVPGTVAHADSHDVILVQLAGSKHWTCGSGPHRPLPGEGPDLDIVDTLWSGTLEPAGTLALSRGTVHRATPDGSMSIHVSLGVRRPSLADVAEWALVGTRAVLNDDLMADALDGAVDLVAERILDATGGVVTGEVLARLLAEFRFAQPPRRVQPLGMFQHALQHPEAVVLRWACPGGVVVSADRNDATTLGVAGHVVELETADLDPFRRLLAGERLGFDAWRSHHDGASAVGQLVSLGLCEPLPREDAEAGSDDS